jgi:hypothetical protein
MEEEVVVVVVDEAELGACGNWKMMTMNMDDMPGI